MVENDYVRGYEEGVTVMVNAIDQAIKRNNGSKTVADCIAALNDIIAASHQARSEVTSYKYSTAEPSIDELLRAMFPGAQVFKLYGGEGK